MSRSSCLAILLVAAIAIRLIVVPVGLKQPRSRGIGAYDEYGTIAKNIVERRGFSYDWFGDTHPTSIHAPVYPYVLAGLFSLFGYGAGGALAAILLSIAISGLLMYVVFRSSESLFGTSAGFFSLVILAFYPVQIFYSANVLPTIIYEGAFFLAIMFAWQLKQNPSAKNALLWGISLGFGALSYSFVLALAPLLALWIFFSTERGRLRAALLSVSLAAIVTILICAPWTIRNYRVHQRLIPIRDQMGTNLWGGNGPLASGNEVEDRGKSLAQFPDDIAEAIRSIPNEVDQDRYLRARAVQYMRENPKRTAALWLVKLRSFWWFRKGNVGDVSGLNRFMPLLKTAKALLLVLSAVGAVFVWRRSRSLTILGLIACLSITVVFMVTLADRVRYFTPLEPVLAIPAGYAVANILGRIIPNKIPRAPLHRKRISSS